MCPSRPPCDSLVNADQFSNLAMLGMVPSAAYDSYETSQRHSRVEGTRAELINDKTSWINNKNRNQFIYILYGIAGIGKSTVEKTLAERAIQSNALVLASSRGTRTAEKQARWFFPVLAYHLARYNEDYAIRINDVSKRDPDAPGRGVRAQLDSLIVEPLRPVMKEEIGRAHV